MPDRESHDLFFGAPEMEAEPTDEKGRFAVRIVYLDGVERFDADDFESLRAALGASDQARANLAAAGYDHTRVSVDVVDLANGDRGSLDWGLLDTRRLYP